MKLNVFDNTCSMAELGGVTVKDLKNPQKLIEKLKEMNHNCWEREGTIEFRSVIYNTIFGPKQRKVLRQAGFKLVNKYKGTRKTVYSFIKNFRGKLG